MTTATRTTTLANDAEITVKATAAIVDDVVNADGHKVNVGTKLVEDTKIVAKMGGKVVATDWSLTWFDEPQESGAVARMGKIQLRKDNADQIQAIFDEAVAEVTTDEIVEYKREQVEAREMLAEEADAHAAHVARIESVE